MKKNRTRFVSILTAVALLLTFLTPLSAVPVRAAGPDAGNELEISDEAAAIEGAETAGEEDVQEDGEDQTGEEDDADEDDDEDDSDANKVDISNVRPDTYETVEINSMEDFAALVLCCHDAGWSLDKSVVLNVDLDFSGEEFEPIRSFAGIFDGQGHTLSGIVISEEVSETGVFGTIQNTGIVANLSVEGSLAPSGYPDRIGGIAGLNYGTITGCTFAGTVSADTRAGGIAGQNGEGGIVIGCTAEGSVEASSACGGIVGYNEGTVSSCENAAEINTVYQDSTMSLDEIEETLDSILQNGELFNSGSLSSDSDTGGIAGFSSGAVTSCTNRGTVGYEHVGYNVGGIVGRSSGLVYNSVNYAEIYGRKDVGGVVGQMQPYLTITFTQETLDELDEELDRLGTLVEEALDEFGDSSTEISNHLTNVMDLLEIAEDAISEIADEGGDALDSAVDSFSDAGDRLREAIHIFSSVGESMEDYLEDVAGSVDGLGDDLSDYLDGLASSLTELVEDIGAAFDGISLAIDGSDLTEEVSNAVSQLQQLLESLQGSSYSFGTGSDDGTSDEDENENGGDTDDNSDTDNDSNNDTGDDEPDSNDSADGDENENENDGSGDTDDNSDTDNDSDDDAEDNGSDSNSSTEEDSSPEEETGNGSVTEEEDAAESQSSDDDSEGQSEDQEKLSALKPDGVSLASITEATTGAATGINGGGEDLSAGELQEYLVRAGLVDTETGLYGTEPEGNARDGAAEYVSETVLIATAGSSVEESDQSSTTDTEEDTDTEENTEDSDGEEETDSGTNGDGTDTGDISYDTGALTELMQAIEELQAYAQSVQGVVSSEELAQWLADNSLTGTLSDISDSIDALESSVSGIGDALGEYSGSSADISELTDALADALDVIEDTPDIGDELDTAMDLLTSIDLQLDGISDTMQENGDILYEALSQMTEEMEAMNQSVSGATDSMGDSLDAVIDQFDIVTDTLVDSVEDLMSNEEDPEDRMEDISDETDGQTYRGRASQCVNYGAVNADINVGGIAGMIGVEYSLDPELDIDSSGSSTLDYAFRARCVVDNSENRGTVTTRSNYAGGIVGHMELGLAAYCENYGGLDCSGNYIGGIAGYSAGTVRNCTARCDLSGGKYVGGIAGYGTTLRDNIAMVEMLDAGQFTGAIAGRVDNIDPAYISDNYYYSTALYGIDGASYEEIAQGLSYEELMEMADLPDSFDRLVLTFRDEGEEEDEAGEILAVVTCGYGDGLSEEDLPQIPEREGFYGVWSRTDYSCITEDETIMARYYRYVTLLTSEQTRENGLPVLETDGNFTVEDGLTVTEESTEAGELERWSVAIPEDGSQTHQIRYLKPESARSVSLYLVQDGSRTQLETGDFGEYLTFTAEGNELTLAVESGLPGSSGSMWKLVVPLVAAAVLLAVLIPLIRIHRRRKRRRREAGNREDAGDWEEDL